MLFFGSLLGKHHFKTEYAKWICEVRGFWLSKCDFWYIVSDHICDYKWVPDIKPTGLEAESYNMGLQAEHFVKRL